MVSITSYKFSKQHNINETISWFLSKKSSYLDEDGPWVVRMIAENICSLYQALSKNDSDHETNLIYVPEINHSDYKNADESYLKPVLQLQSKVKNIIEPYLVDFLIHGSIATLDYSLGWSDLDTLVIIKNETLFDPKKLIELRTELLSLTRYLFNIDPLQHHGFIYCTEFDLSQYYSGCLPIQVLRESKSLIRSSTYKITNCRLVENKKKSFINLNNLLERASEDGILKHHRYKGKYLLENYVDMETMFQMKYFLSIIMSLPIYFLDAVGKPCYKKYSFELIRSIFGSEWEIIEKATLIRALWPEKVTYPYNSNKIPGWLPNILGNDYFKRSYNLSQSMLAMINEPLALNMH